MSGKVLITGGAGFIGFHLARLLLNRGWQVHLVDNFMRGRNDQDLETILDEEGITLSNIDLLSNKLTSELGIDFEVIYHLAAIVGVVHVTKRPYSVLYDNIVMLANVISLAKQQKDLSRLVFSSTSEVYAGTLQHFSLSFPTPECTPLAVADVSHPRTSYMLSKIYGEALCHQSGLPFTIVRPHNIYGPRMGMAHVIPEQLRKAYDADDGGSIEVYSSDHSRCFCYVDDAVEMLTRIVDEKGCEGEILNIGSEGPEVTMQEISEICIQTAGKNLLIQSLPPISGSPKRRCPNMSLLTELIGYEPLIGLREGIEITWRWYKDMFEQGSVSAI